MRLAGSGRPNHQYDAHAVLVPSDDTWVELTVEPLAVAAAYEWAVTPSCGAVVVFSGTVRDHAEGRTGVTALTYEAYDEQVTPRLLSIADEIRSRWPDVGRVALLHRVGELALGESSVLVVVSAPHRGDAFEAARHGIDTLKATVPIWKKEHWEGGSDWALAATEIETIERVDIP